MKKVPAKEFAKNFGRWREEAQKGAVAVSVHNRITGFFISIDEYSNYLRLKALAPNDRSIEELSEDAIKAIAESKLGTPQDRLYSVIEMILMCTTQLERNAPKFKEPANESIALEQDKFFSG